MSAAVAVFRWPQPDFTSVVQNEDDGKFSATRLPSGEYRVLAVPPELRRELDKPGTLERLAPRAEKVTLTRGGSASLNLRVIDPTR